MSESSMSCIETSPLWLSKKKSLSVAVAVALGSSTPGQAAEDDTSELVIGRWKNNIELRYLSDGDGNYRAQLAGLIPFRETGNSLTYVDARFLLGNDSINEGNFGIGHRVFSGDRRWILGAHAFFDTRRSASNRRYNQLSVGAEALSDNWEFRGNYYYPTTDKKQVGIANNSGGVFSGNSLTADGIFEEALQGYDFEVGGLLPLGNKYETRLYLGRYDFSGDVTDNDAEGWKARIEFRPQKNITLGLTHQDDDLFGSRTFFSLNYSFGYAPKAGVRSLRERMVQLVERDIDIIDTSGLDFDKRISTSSNGQVLVSNDVVHIDNASTGTNEGTLENPYTSVNACDMGTGLNCASAEIIYTHEGNADYIGSFSLGDNQRLIGSGVDFLGIASTVAPVFSTSGTTVTLANNNEVAGLDIDGAGDHGIVGNNVTDFNIHDNILRNNTGHGVAIQLDENGPTTVTGRIANNVISGNSGHGIYVGTSLTGTASSFNQNLNIIGNTITGNGDDGINIGAYIDGDFATLNQTLTISSNTITGNSDDGIDIYADINGDYATLNQTLTISNNAITGNDDDGIDIETGLDGDYAAFNQTLTISNNTITGNSDDGINIYTGLNGDYTSNNQTIIISDNSITGNSSDGIEIGVYFDEVYYANSAQNITISGNTITGTGSDIGIYVWSYFDYNDGITNTQTVNINENIISNFSTGVQVANISEDDHLTDFTSSSQIINIVDNTITGISQDGIAIENYLYGDYSNFTQTITITGNTITGTGAGSDNGIQIYNELLDGYDSSVSQTITIENNTIMSFDDDGIDIKNDSEDADGLATQNITIIGNTIRDNGDDGIDIYNNGSFGNATQTINLNSNTITNNAGNGIYLDNLGGAGITTQTATLIDNTISNSSGGHGILINNESNGPGSATQTVTLTGTTITGSDESDVAVYNENNVYSIQSATSGGGNAFSLVTYDDNGIQTVDLP